MEEQGAISYWSVIFQASSFSDLLDRLNMIAEIAHADQSRLEQIRNLSQQVTETRTELALEKLALEDAKRELKAAQDQMTVKRSEAEGLLLMLIIKGGEYDLDMDEAEKLQHELMEDLAQSNKELEDAKYREWLATSVPPTTQTPTTNPAGDGNEVGGITWYVPTKNYWISSRYGWRIHPLTGKRTFHYGIDMAAPQGTPIYATRAGVVTDAKFQDGGAGYYVWLSHGDGYSSVYMHMTKFIVKEGDYVTAGQIIGYVGSTVGSTGPHLHFGITYRGTYVNPLDYIDP
jgi:murein DD-endopeptidase MepM/ murein hydrolase activator NlpD